MTGAKPQTAKKRRYPRIELPKGMLVAWQAKGKRSISRVSTLGMGGLFIATSEPPPVGTVLHLVFTIPGGDVRARASVQSVEPGKGMGIEFKGMSAEERARLAHLLRRLLP